MESGIARTIATLAVLITLLSSAVVAQAAAPDSEPCAPVPDKAITTSFSVLPAQNQTTMMKF
jgi:hypothetical protein